jgi:hypothetical protein
MNDVTRLLLSLIRRAAGMGRECVWARACPGVRPARVLREPDARGRQRFRRRFGGRRGAGDFFVGGAHDRDVIIATLTLVFNENTPDERRETMVVPLRKIGDLMLVKSERL